MKKWIHLILFTITLVTLSACINSDEIVVTEVTFDSTLLEESFLIGDFNIEDFELIVRYSDGLVTTVPISQNMISTSDLLKLNQTGSQTIEVLYQGFKVTLIVHLTVDNDFITLLKNIYQTGLTTGSIRDLTYEEWLENIRGEQGLPGSDGKDGLTPFIGDNGNWWIGNQDLGVSTGHKSENIENFSEGLVFSLTTYNGQNAYVVTGYYGSDKNVVIPGYFNGLKVVGIGGFAFLHGWQSNIFLIESVFIPKEVEFIGVYAVGDQPYLTEVVFEEKSSLRIIDANAFNYTGISKIRLPESLLYIGNSAFGSNQLTSVTIEGDESRFNETWISIGFPEELMP